MSRLIVDVFAEDKAHEEFLRAMLQRLVSEEGGDLSMRMISSRGGHGRALDEFKVYQRAISRSLGEVPDLVVVAIDANCQRWNQARTAIEQLIDGRYLPSAVIACPDPHIERWYLADPPSFHQVVGASLPEERIECERERYKAVLREAVSSGGHKPTLGGIEFAREIVEAMDLFRAARNNPSLDSLLADARGAIRRLRR